MCLAVPAKVVEFPDESTARVNFFGNTRVVSAILVPEVKLNDYVLIHAGCAIAIIDEQSALETLKLWRELGELGEQ